MNDTATVSLAERFAAVRARTHALAAPLEPEDTVVQSMPDVSPTKWHLAHTSWFFERFVLGEYADDYTVFDESYDYLFNSYYYTAGQMHPRPERGLITRPTFPVVLAYRTHVDEAMLDLIGDRAGDEKFASLVLLGLHHEQQHQELILTDILHVLYQNPTLPAYDPNWQPPAASESPLLFNAGETGVVEIGATGEGFCFDNETPRHEALLSPHTVANRLITNDEYRDFIADGGYAIPELWLSDGWAAVNERGWRAPLYWNDEHTHSFTLGGMRELDPHAPVTNVSYYEADAYARWAGARLPTEFEWERAALRAEDSAQFFGHAWQWTSSAYAPYPGFKPLDGCLGEYNGKFMSGQMSVRGSSHCTSSGHERPTYRSFFYPDARWQVLGIRLAKDAS